MRVSGIPYVQGRNAFADADGTKFGIAIHNTSNDGTAEDEASFAKRRTDNVSSHFYADDNSVIQSLDTDSKAGHAGSNTGNQNAVAVEITGFNGWSRQKWLDNVAWELLGSVLAQVCRHYGIAVRRASVAEMQASPKVRAFYSHDDMRRAWGGTDHTDPGPNFPWDRLFQAVNNALGGATAPTGGDDDLDALESAKLDAIYNAKATTKLPGGGEQVFTVPLTAKLNEIAGKVDTLQAAAVADEVRDSATLAAVRALAVATGNDPQPIFDAITAARDEAHAGFTALQQQLAAVQARNVRLAEALAAAGGALDGADD